jgi:hypothetical protein
MAVQRPEFDDGLHVGDVLQLEHGPFTSDWKVVQIKEHGAVLEFAGMVFLTGFKRPITAPNGVQLTDTVYQEWLGRAHFASAIMNNWPGTVAKPDPCCDDDELVAEHSPIEEVGGTIGCTCGWPTKEDYVNRPSEWEPNFSEHFLNEMRRMG